MRTYTTVFSYNEGNFEFLVITNHTFLAENHEKAIEKAAQLQDIPKFFKPYYDKQKDDIVVDMIDNDYFSDVIVSDFQFYDETKGDYEYMKIGETLYPVGNPEYNIYLTKGQFLTLLKEHYNEYLQNKEVITFGSICYEVKEIQYIYKVFHSYGDEKDFIFFKSSIPYNELIEILACIDFKYEDLVDESSIPDSKKVLKILEEFYGVEKLSNDLIKKFNELTVEEPFLFYRDIASVYLIYEDDYFNQQFIEIDRYSARESCCNPNYLELMDKHLPNTPEFIEAIKRNDKTIMEIIEEGKQNGKSAYEALKEAGYIKNSLEFL